MSDAFDRFRYSFFEDPTSARDGLDIASLRAIEDYERGEAERLLLAFLPDARAVIGLGVLRSAKAEVELSRLFDTERKQQIDARNDPAMQPGGSNEWYPSAMLYLAQALWRIRPEPRWPQAVIEVLASARDWVFRHEAVLVLAGIGEPDAVEALVNAFDDEEPLVRHGAARAAHAPWPAGGLHRSASRDDQDHVERCRATRDRAARNPGDNRRTGAGEGVKAGALTSPPALRL